MRIISQLKKALSKRLILFLAGLASGILIGQAAQSTAYDPNVLTDKAAKLAAEAHNLGCALAVKAMTCSKEKREEYAKCSRRAFSFYIDMNDILKWEKP